MSSFLRRWLVFTWRYGSFLFDYQEILSILYRLVRYHSQAKRVYEMQSIRKITFNWTIQKILFFCIAVGFLLSVCCYVKLIKHLFFTLLLLFGLSFSLIYVKRAMTVKHLLTKVKAFSFRSTARLSYCLDRQMLLT